MKRVYQNNLQCGKLYFLKRGKDMCLVKIVDMEITLNEEKITIRMYENIITKGCESYSGRFFEPTQEEIDIFKLEYL